MGGLQYGRESGRTAVKAFLDAWRSRSSSEPISDALARSLQATNDAVLQFAAQAGAVGQTGATLIAAVVEDGALHWVSVGDSGLFLFRRGKLSLLNVPHIYANELDAKVASGQISREEALNDPQRLSLTSYLGITELTEVDRSVRPLPLQAGDRVMISSDGLFKTLSDDEMAAELATDPQHACEALLHKALDKRHPDQDNVTVLVLGAEDDAASAPPPPPPVTGRKPRNWALAVLTLAAVAGLGAATGWRFMQAKKVTAPTAPEFIKVAGETPFEIGRLEVTQRVWQATMGTNPSHFPGPDRPVEQVSYDDVQQFLDKLNQRNDGYTYRLPAESEWELAARDSGGPLAAVAWTKANSGGETHAAGTKQPNAIGASDMLGNVREWCAASKDAKPAVRGGSYNDDPSQVSAATRAELAHDTRDSSVGFRIVRTHR